MIEYASSLDFQKMIDKIENLPARWLNSPALMLKRLLPKQKGAFMEAFCKQVLASRGASITDRLSPQHDFLMDGQKVELKGSTETVKLQDEYTLLQIRPTDDYDLLMVILFSPESFTIAALSKPQLQKCIAQGLFYKQHGGARGDGYTYGFNGNPLKLPGIEVLV